MTKLLPENQIEDSMLTLDNWNLEENEIDQLTKEFEFDSFSKAIEFINKIEKITKTLNFYPDILLHSQKTVEIMITNYEYEGITQECIDIAFEIDGLD